MFVEIFEEKKPLDAEKLYNRCYRVLRAWVAPLGRRGVTLRSAADVFLMNEWGRSRGCVF